MYKDGGVVGDSIISFTPQQHEPLYLSFPGDGDPVALSLRCSASNRELDRWIRGDDCRLKTMHLKLLKNQLHTCHYPTWKSVLFVDDQVTKEHEQLPGESAGRGKELILWRSKEIMSQNFKMSQ